MCVKIYGVFIIVIFNLCPFIKMVCIKYLGLIFITKFYLLSCYTETCDINSYNNCKENSATAFHQSKKKFLLYNVNPGEGFNLCRDVYMRVASLVKQINEENSKISWVLVLPPWGPLFHWKSTDVGHQLNVPWSLFFEISSLNEYVPVIEFSDFLNENGPEIGELYYLQHYPDFWEDGQWKERFDIAECSENSYYHTAADGNTYGWFWNHDEVYAKDFHCLSVQGSSRTLKPLLKSLKHRTIMIDRAEVILHDSFGDLDYWMVRKSMQFSKQLINIGNEFRATYLDSFDERDLMRFNKSDSVLGGPYLGIHLRRQDFLKGRPNDVPSISHAAFQINKLLKKLNLTLVFVATDAPEFEFKQLKKLVPDAIKFTPEFDVKQKVKDGGIAIIEQWICSHARYFIGTHESTFSFRIQEEREILGFDPDTTFNRFCGNNQTSCKQPSRWRIVDM